MNKIKLLSTYKVRAQWYSGMPSACYAVDPGSNLGGGDCDMAKQIDHFSFCFLTKVRLVWICRVANDGVTISQMMTLTRTLYLKVMVLKN